MSNFLSYRRRSSSERRQHSRFALDLRLRLASFDGQGLSFSGNGASINISSTGIRFRTNADLNGGDKVIAAVDWPVMAESGRMVLVLIGRIVWRSATDAGMEATRYCIVPNQEIDDLTIETVNRHLFPRKLARSDGKSSEPEPALAGEKTIAVA